MIVALTTALDSIAASSSVGAKPSTRAASAMYGAGESCPWSGVR
jgi:hypothetical protein